MAWDQAQKHGVSGRRITGSPHRDLLFGGSGDDTITGNRGNDYMEGDGGSDRFVLKPGDGWDCIGDFQGGAGGDLLDLRGWGGIGSLEDVLAHSHQDRDGLVLDFGPRDGVKLMGLTRDDLSADNLLLKTSHVRADAVFAAVDAGHGDELWGTDGRRTFLLRDIAPGAASSDPQGLVQMGKRAYFSADDGVHGREVWTTDGTPGGTHMVATSIRGRRARRRRRSPSRTASCSSRRTTASTERSCGSATAPPPGRTWSRISAPTRPVPLRAI